MTLNSLAAEVKYHADALVENAQGSYAYKKAIHADMTSIESSTSGIAEEYYNLNSSLVQEQIQYHGEY